MMRMSTMTDGEEVNTTNEPKLGLRPGITVATR